MIRSFAESSVIEGSVVVEYGEEEKHPVGIEIE
jgi:hypothetical protein